MIRLSLLAASLVAILMASGGTFEKEREHFCEMRQVWQETQGEYGWPAESHSKYTDEDCH